MTTQDPTDLVAYIDESKKPHRVAGQVSAKGQYYVVCASVIMRGDHDALKAELTALIERYRGTIHYSDLPKTRRRELARAIAQMDTWDGFVFETSKPIGPAAGQERWARHHCLTKAFVELDRHGVELVVIESRAKNVKRGGLDVRDIQTLDRLRDTSQLNPRFRIEHHTKDDLPLALADIMAGARSDYLTSTDVEPWAHLTHRATTHSI